MQTTEAYDAPRGWISALRRYGEQALTHGGGPWWGISWSGHGSRGIWGPTLGEMTEQPLKILRCRSDSQKNAHETCQIHQASASRLSPTCIRMTTSGEVGFELPSGRRGRGSTDRGASTPFHETSKPHQMPITARSASTRPILFPSTPQPTRDAHFTNLFEYCC